MMTTRMMTTKIEIKKWMKQNVRDNLHDNGWEVNSTALAEDAAINGFNHPEWLDDETHDVWDAAIEVTWWFEKEAE